MPTHKGFSAWICSEGKVLDEFETRIDADGVKATCWIPSDAGKLFTIHWRDHGSHIPSAGYISLDGCVVPGRFLWGVGEACRSGARAGPSTERPFSFAQIENTSSRPSQVPSPQDVGTIILRIKQVQRGDPRSSNSYQVLPPPVSQEWSATTGGHCTSFGREVACYEQFPQTWSAQPWDKANPNSFVKFVFRYRPLEFLKAQGIASSEGTSAKAFTKPTSTYSSLSGALTSFVSNPQDKVNVSAPASVSVTPINVNDHGNHISTSVKRITSGVSMRSTSNSSSASRNTNGGSVNGKRNASTGASRTVSDTTVSGLFREFINFGDERDDIMEVT